MARPEPLAMGVVGVMLTTTPFAQGSGTCHPTRAFVDFQQLLNPSFSSIIDELPTIKPVVDRFCDLGRQAPTSKLAAAL